MPYTLENKVLLDAAARVLTRIYLRTIREEESAAYHVGCTGEISTMGVKPVFFITAQAPTNPDKQKIAEDLMKKYITEAATKIADDDLSPVKEIMLKQADDANRENRHWMDVLTEWTAEGVDLQTNYAQAVKALTPQKVQKFISDFLAAGNQASVVMMPAK
jgi:zinc protease